MMQNDGVETHPLRQRGSEMRQEILTVDEHSEIHLPVGNRGPEICNLELLVFRAGLLIFLESSNDSRTILFRKESCSIGKVVHHEKGERSEANRDDTLNDENPCPAGTAASPIQILDRCCEETSERSRDCCS